MSSILFISLRQMVRKLLVGGSIGMYSTLCLAGSLLLNPGELFAGDCTISGGKVDLNVLFLYNETDLEGWKPVFEATNELLYNSTEGNLQIGMVNFFVACQPAKDKADIWISQGTGGASAHPDGCGKSGWHVFISNIHKRNDSTAHGQLGMTHELGHYIFNLQDEYGGCVIDSATNTKLAPPTGQYMWRNSQIAVMGGGKAFFCSQATGGSSCLMDAGTTITGAFSRTEFCSLSDHIARRNLTVTIPFAGLTDVERGIENNQECEGGGNCWIKIAAKLGVATAPNPPSTTAPSGLIPVVFNDIGAAARFVLCIDNSGSMLGAKIDLARTAARCFVANSRLPRTEFNRQVPGDEVGVVQFNSTASVVSTLREMMTEADKTAVKNAISGISAGGGTAIGRGLRTSLNQLAGKGTPGCIEAIILLSDGQQNTGESPSSVIPDLTARGAVVFSIGLGSGADTATLSNIATATGGRFFFAASPTDLPPIFTEIQATVTGAPILARVKRTLEANQEELLPFGVDANISLVKVTFTAEATTTFLVSPSGVVSNESTQAPGVVFHRDGPVGIYTMDQPETGIWTLGATRFGAGTGEGTLVVFAPASALDGLSLQADGAQNIDFGAEPDARLIIEAALSEGPPVLGASVFADVTRPDGTVLTVAFLDDGEPSSGDNSFRDGVYSILFTDFAGDGAYVFDIKADSNGATVCAGCEDGPIPPLSFATPATRSLTFTVNVANAPSNQPPVCTDDAFVSLWPPNHKFVTIDAEALAGATDPDGDPLTFQITGITQDEMINSNGDGNTSCDAVIVSSTVAKVRVERRGGGNGRVYQIHYIVDDGQGGSCTGLVTVTAPHDQDGIRAVDDGQTINSLTCMPTADVTGDGIVSFADITLILADWGKFGPDETLNWPDGDTNFDGGVNFSDITEVLGQWGMSSSDGDWQPLEP